MRTLMGGRSQVSADTRKPLSLCRLSTDGVIISVFNPKIAVFFLAFLPQFVEPSQGPVEQQVLLLGLLYLALALTTDGGYALLAGSLRQWFNGGAMQGRLSRYLGGSVYVGLGVNTALIGRPD